MRFLILLITVALARPASGASADLFRQFQDPPHTYSVHPFWFWNGKLDARELERQIDEMVSQGVYAAYVHNRTGLQTPYLSEEYFRVVGATLAKAKQAGFHLDFVDEYEWPGGDARDVWLKGLPSRVIAANPEFRMQGLWYSFVDVNGPTTAEISGIRQFQFAVAARLTGNDTLDGSTLIDISSAVAQGKLSWRAPDGHWRVMEFHLEDAQGRDGGLVDLMNPRAIRTFINLVHEQYYKRFSQYFGSTIDSIYSDHEGDYGGRIAWTPALFDEFRVMKGYDLRKYIPLLLLDGGKITTKIRCDYLDVISELYSKSYFKQVAGWAEAHHLKISGHLWEGSLHSEPASDGDLQRNMTAWSWPGVDSLNNAGRDPRDFKVVGSVAHFRGTRFTCENQGLQGSDSYFDLQKARFGTNPIAAWGVNLFIPHAFNYNSTRIEYPPDWFYHQPYWKYFRRYADYTRRLSFMNDGGRHFAPILYFHPKETAWAYSNARWPKKADSATNPLTEINKTYTAVMNRLEAERWDFDMADSHYLAMARIDGGQLHLGNESYRVLLLPPMTTIRRSTLSKIREFYNRGGMVIAIGRLPGESMEEGRDDPEIAAGIRAIFGGVSSGKVFQQSNAAGGKAIFVPGEIDDLIRVLGANLIQDVKVTSGPADHLYALHREKEDTDFYYLVNDTGEARDNIVVLSKRGVPERWDAETGRREALESRVTSQGTGVKLHFAPWDAYYVVFAQQPLQVAPSEPVGKPLPPIVLAGLWTFRPERSTVAAPYATYREEGGAAGESAGWEQQEYDDRSWTRQWLSRERLAIRDWWLVGPFPNIDHKGCIEKLPPETNPDPRATYGGFSWKRLHAGSYAIDLDREFGIPAGADATAYALTYVYSPASRKVQFRIAANNNAHLLVNGKKLLDWHIHPYYYELREDFALAREAELHAGWNEVLLKISRFARKRAYGFYCRVTDERGDSLDDLIISPEKQFPEATGSKKTYAWYRIPVPPASTGIELPAGSKPAGVYLNGQKLAAGKGGLVRFPAPAEGAGTVLALRLPPAGLIRDMPRFELGTGKLELGSWVAQGLPYYSGGAFYEKDFDLPPEYAARKLMLDCGAVGVTAEVWVNGNSAGSRVWQPFSFDISDLVRPGRNRLRILVTNTMANERAVENHAGMLPKIDVDGLQGPVRIVAGAPLAGRERPRR